MDIPLIDRLSFSVADASEVTGVGRSQIYEAVASGELPAKKRGISTLILADDLRAWLSSLPAWKPSHGRVEAAARARDGQVAKRRAVTGTPRREAAAARAQAVAHRAKAETISAAR